MRLLGLLACLFLPSVLRAEPNPLEVRLISETKSIAAGKTFHLGLHLKHPPGAHSYWKNPGIVGLATKIKWELPPGFSAGESQWPAPRIVKMASYEAQGYEGETLIIIPINAPEKLPNQAVTFTAKVSWMCCGKTCQPVLEMPFSLTLPVAAVAESEPATQDLFAKFRGMVPRRDPAWKTAVKREHGKFILTIAPPAAISNAAGIHFFTSDGQVDSNQKQQVEILANGTLRMILGRSETGPQNSVTLLGVLVFPDRAALEIDPRY